MLLLALEAAVEEPAEPDVDAAVCDGEFEVGLPLELSLVEPEFDAGADEAAGITEDGLWPSRYLMLCPVLCGSEATLARLLASLNATVVFDASVQEQYEPGWRVEGFPFCEHGAQAPSLSSQSVSAIHGWSMMVSEVGFLPVELLTEEHVRTALVFVIWIRTSCSVGQVAAIPGAVNSKAREICYAIVASSAACLVSKGIVATWDEFIPKLLPRGRIAGPIADEVVRITHRSTVPSTQSLCLAIMKRDRDAQSKNVQPLGKVEIGELIDRKEQSERQLSDVT